MSNKKIHTHNGHGHCMHCAHYCSPCNESYCCKCDETWGAKLTPWIVPYPVYPRPQYPWITWYGTTADNKTSDYKYTLDMASTGSTSNSAHEHEHN